MKKVAIIGGGASGILAGIYAAENDCKVTIYEKLNKLGKKILISGNGRCNISNSNISSKNYNGHNPKIVNNIFSKFSPENTRNFFLSIGIPFKEEKNGKLFPSSLQSSTITRILQYKLEQNNVQIRLEVDVKKIYKNENKFIIKTDKDEKKFDSVIIATGGRSFPKLGGNKTGYEIAKSFNHKVYHQFPAILPISIPMKSLHKLQGIKWDCKLFILHKNKIIDSSNGELLFTAYGISGPATLDISRTVNQHIIENKEVEIVIDFFPNLDESQLKNILENLWIDKNKKIEFSLIGILKDKIPNFLLKSINIDPNSTVASLNSKQKKDILYILKNLSLKNPQIRDINDAVVTSGGIDVNEINPKTMESKLVKDLYFTGEILDIDGISGGYNLQFAWSCGAIAGMAQHN